MVAENVAQEIRSRAGQDRPHLVAPQGADLTERGPLRFQARVRRTGRLSQTRTFETAADADGWGVGVLDGFNRDTFVDRRQESRTTLGDVLEQYKETGLTGRKSHESPHFVKDSCWPYFAAKS